MISPTSQKAREALANTVARHKLPAPPQEAVAAACDNLKPDAYIDGEKLLRAARGKAESMEGGLRRDLFKSHYKDPALGQKLATTHAFVAGVQDITMTARLESAKSAVAAATDASFGPASMVAAYWGYLNIRGEQVADLTKRLEDLETGKSASLLPGNKVAAVHHEEVWPQMLHLVEEATESARQGKPVEIDAQYFELSNPEFVGKLSQAAQAGNHVRINVDPGRLQPFMNRYEIDEIPVKLRALQQLAKGGGDMAISAYPISKQLGSTEDLMHRKVLRVGEQVLLSGMNANEGSGENIDGGYVIEGPAARQLGQNLARDIKNSAGSSYSEIYGDSPIGARVNGQVPGMGARGLAALFDVLSGPSPAGTDVIRATNHAELEAQAQKAGLNLADLVPLPPDQIDAALKQGDGLPLTEKAYGLVEKLMKDTIGQINAPENTQRLNSVTAPEGAPAGNTVVGVADLPSEREALLLHGIAQAEEFTYIPAYVITRPVAAALIARKEQLEAEGKHLDVRMVVDSGVFPDGTSPNFLGATMLEDAGMPVRWVTLPRSGDHDRKLHAKMMLTDKGEYFGSTNFSKKGLKENWEESGLVQFDPHDPASMAQREVAKERFLRLWDNMSVEVDSRALAGAYAHRTGAQDQDNLTEALRESAMRNIINQVERFEVESGKWIEQQVRNPEIARRVEQFRLEGIDEGSARLLAVESQMGTEKFFGALSELGSHQKLVSLVQSASNTQAALKEGQANSAK